MDDNKKNVYKDSCGGGEGKCDSRERVALLSLAVTAVRTAVDLSSDSSALLKLPVCPIPTATATTATAA